MLWRSLRLKLVLVYTLLILFAVELIGAYFVSALTTSLIRNQSNAAKSQAELMATLVSPQIGLNGKAISSSMTNVLQSVPEFLSGTIYVLNQDGYVTYTTAGGALVGQKRTDTVSTQALLHHSDAVAVRFDPLTKEHLLAVAVPMNAHNKFFGILEYVLPIQTTYDTIRQATTIFYTGSIAVLMLTILLGIIVSRALTRPVLDVTRQARVMAAGDFSKRVEAISNDEFGDLVVAINHLADELDEALSEQEKLNQARRDFVSNVSHELRTPLTSVKSYIEALRDLRQDEEETRTSFLKVIDEETDRMVRLTRDLLQLSGLDRGESFDVRQPISVHSLFAEMSQRFMLQAERQQLTLRVEIPETDIRLYGNHDMVNRILDNLVSNSMKYTPSGGVIDVYATIETSHVILVVEDNGVGIPMEDLPHVFERFYRVDKGRSRRHGGTGLGLALAREMAERLGGQIHISSEPEQGTRVQVTLARDVGVSES